MQKLTFGSLRMLELIAVWMDVVKRCLSVVHIVKVFVNSGVSCTHQEGSDAKKVHVAEQNSVERSE